MSRRNLGSCLVCGEAAISINFGVPTCPPCKTFFRRNALKLGKIDFFCPRDGDCAVTYITHRKCNCCRLAKCFRVGMQKSLIRSEAENESRRELVKQNREKLMRLSNIHTLSSIRPSNLLRSTYSQSRCLCPSDQILLTNIASAYERTCMVTKKNTTQYFPSKPHSSIHSFLNEYNDRHVSLIEYFKLIPEFNKISIDDKVRLLTNHIGTMIGLNEAANQPGDCATLFKTLKSMYGIQLAIDICRNIDSLQKYACDPILLKLLLIIRSLSSGINRNHFEMHMNNIYDDTKIIFLGQNVYVELLWRYILSRLPSEGHAVKFFNKLILDLLFMMRVTFAIDDRIYSCPDEIDQFEPLMQSMWPKSNTKTI